MLDQAAGNAPDYNTGKTGTPIGTPITIDEADSETWDEECDVLVIGCGLAGATAALKAAEAQDLSIIIADRLEGGGASQASGGVLYLGGGTRVQKELGITDTVEAMTDYLASEVGDAVSHDTLKKFCAESASFIPWLESHGALFGGPLSEAKTSYPFDEFLYFSANERLGESVAIAPPAPRGHRAKPSNGVNGGYSGVDLMLPLKAALERASNVSFHRQTAARRLIMDASGRVVGAELWQVPPGSLSSKLLTRLVGLSTNMILALLGLTRPVLAGITGIERKYTKRRRVRARRAVVIASGGFISNRQMLAKQAPVFRHVGPLGTIGDDGSGIMMGQSVGGAADKMNNVSPWRFLYPPASWGRGILVSRQGSRIVNEEAYGARIGTAIFERAGGEAWLILDKPTLAAAKTEAASPRLQAYQKYIAKAAHTKYSKTCNSIEELADKIGIPAAALTKTVRDYNNAIAANRPDALGKAKKLCTPIITAPFTALDLSYKTMLNPITGITVGGLKVDEANGNVIGHDGKPVPGLYAVGRSAVGIPSNVYVSGLSLADCVFSGLRAARAIAGNA